MRSRAVCFKQWLKWVKPALLGMEGQRQTEEPENDLSPGCGEVHLCLVSQASIISFLLPSPGDHRRTDLTAGGLPGQDEEGRGVHSEPRL